ncbi:hypothetical protein NL676_015973 [Syzygium grande]|nr:hypothetical protein NL676_015973 [Syzygium grande]
MGAWPLELMAPRHDYLSSRTKWCSSSKLAASLAKAGFKTLGHGHSCLRCRLATMEELNWPRPRDLMVIDLELVAVMASRALSCSQGHEG